MSFEASIRESLQLIASICKRINTEVERLVVRADPPEGLDYNVYKKDIQHAVRICQDAANQGKAREAFQLSIRLSETAQSLYNYLFKLDSSNAKQIEPLNVLIKELDELIDNLSKLNIDGFGKPQIVGNKDSVNNNVLNDIDNLTKKVEEQAHSIYRMEHLTAERNLNLEGKIKLADEKLSELDQSIDSHLKNINTLYNEESAALAEKREEINKTFSIAAGSLLSGGYEKQARNEMIAAEITRGIAVILMGVIVWKTITLLGNAEFELVSALTRLGVILILSIPTAYFSRESGKHRKQQYHYIQTALDLHAVNLYIDDLKDDIKHPLKAKIASRIFATKNQSPTESESYPVNTHELMCKLLDKIDVLIESKKPTK